MQRYHAVISSFGGKTSYDVDNRPLLVMRSILCATVFAVVGTDQSSLGQFFVRVHGSGIGGAGRRGPWLGGDLGSRSGATGGMGVADSLPDRDRARGNRFYPAARSSR